MAAAYYAIGYAQPNFPDLNLAVQNAPILFAQLEDQGFCSIPLNSDTLEYLKNQALREDWFSSVDQGGPPHEIAFMEITLDGAFQQGVQAVFQSLHAEMCKSWQLTQEETITMSRCMLRRHATIPEITSKGVKTPRSNAVEGRNRACKSHTDSPAELFSAVVAVPVREHDNPATTQYVPASHTAHGHEQTLDGLRNGSQVEFAAMPPKCLNIWCAAGVRFLASMANCDGSNCGLLQPLVHRAPFDERTSEITTRVAAIFSASVQTVINKFRDSQNSA